MIKAALVGDPSRVPKAILAKIPEIKGACQVSMARLVIRLARKIQAEKLSGQVLKNRTGTLRRSITPNVFMSGDTTIGTVSTNKEYAAIHEFGGKTVPHTIMPKKGRALAFQFKGKMAFFKKVNHPGSVMPERSFMRTALAEMRPEIVKAFREAIFEVIAR